MDMSKLDNASIVAILKKSRRDKMRLIVLALIIGLGIVSTLPAGAERAITISR
jgi:hypothetical protein